MDDSDTTAIPSAAEDENSDGEDTLLQLAALAEPMGGMSNEEIDIAIYEV